MQRCFFVVGTEEGTEPRSTTDAYVVTSDGVSHPLFIPGASVSGIKATPVEGTFTIPVNGTVSMTADLDISKSLFKLSSAADTLDQYILRPTFRLVVEDQAGRITGTVTYNGSVDNQLVVYVYEDDTFTADSTFTAAFLAAGLYDLYVAEYTADGTLIDTVEDSLTAIADVEVTADQTTALEEAVVVTTSKVTEEVVAE